MCVHARRSLASFVALVGAINANRQFKTRVNNNIAVCTRPVRDAVCVREYHPIAAYKVKAATCLAVSVGYENSTGIVPCALCAQWFAELTMIVKKKNCSSIKLCPAKYTYSVLDFRPVSPYSLMMFRRWRRVTSTHRCVYIFFLHINLFNMLLPLVSFQINQIH